MTESYCVLLLVKVNTLSPLFKHQGLNPREQSKNATLEQCGSGEFIS